MSLLQLLKKGGIRKSATAIVATIATDGTSQVPKVATIAGVAVAKEQVFETIAHRPDTTDPDRWCWPNSTAMNTREIDIFKARLARFAIVGISNIEAERLADNLVTRDRDADDRRLCMECRHLSGRGARRCGNWQAAGISLKAREVELPADLLRQFQYCNGFASAILNTTNIQKSK